MRIRQDAAYRTMPDRDHRAMAGLSMGGMQTLFVTLHHLDRFSYIGSFSGPVIPGINTGREPQGHTPEEFDSKTAYEGAFADPRARSEERRVGKECRARRSA